MDSHGRTAAEQEATRQLAALRASGANLLATRHARRVYVGGLAPDVEDAAVARFFDQAMEATGATRSGGSAAGCVVSTYINREKQFAFVEFRTVEEASNCLAFDGILWQGSALRVRRPNDYNLAQAALLGPTGPSPHLNLAAIGIARGQHAAEGTGGIGSTVNSNSPFKVFVGGLPAYLTDDQVRELVASFGALRAFNVVRDKDTGLSKGYGFFEYADPAVTDTAVEALNGMRLGDRTINVKLANANNPAALLETHASRAVSAEATMLTGGVETAFVRLKGMVTRDELLDPSEAAEILEDTQEECRGFGSLIKAVMPLPAAEGEAGDPPGVGEMFLRFADVDSARRAQRSLNGRKFADRLVTAVFIAEAEYVAKDAAIAAAT